MVTGIETTGLVLAIVPLIVKKLDDYVQGVETIKSFRTKKYRRYLDERAAILGGQHAILMNSLETILEDLLPEEQLSKLIADANHPLWAGSTVRKHMEEKLGRSYIPFRDLMSQVSQVLEELAGKMGITLDALSTQGQGQTQAQNVITARGLQRIKDILSKKIYDDLFENLNNLNHIIRTLVDQSATQSPQQKLKARSKESTRRYAKIRETTASLYETLTSRQNWQCSCFDRHFIHFLLNKDLNVCDRLKPDPFSLVLLTPTTTSSRWHEIEASTSLAQPKSCVSSSNIALRPQRVSSASISTTNPATQTASGKSNTQTSTPALSDICHAVYSCSPQAPNKRSGGIPIGHLSDGKYIHDFQVMKADAGSLEINTLEQILSASLSATGSPVKPLFVPRKERCFLAAKLASTVLECHGSWLPSNWSSRSIIFTEKITPVNLERTIRAPVIVHKLSDPPDSSFQGYPLSWTRHNELLFPLGLALIELSPCRPFTYPHNSNYQTVDEISTLFEMARNWIYDVSCESGPRYGDVVQQCLFWTKTRELDMESEEFQASVFQYIIKPLVEDFNQFDDI